MRIVFPQCFDPFHERESRVFPLFLHRINIGKK
jgi:hypothetical protein